jgi:hypothetical protein
MHFGHDSLFRYWTDSGRSSLRLALERLSGRRFAVPDFLCGVVIDALRAHGIAFSLYHVNGDLSIDHASLGRDFDVLYTIDYFGKPTSLDRTCIPCDVLLLRDAVFTPANRHPVGQGDWVWFNSFRKISPLCDGSLIVSTLELDASRISAGVAPFVAAKHRAKVAKDAYLREGRGTEAAYVKLFEEGERLLDEQADIHSISPQSMARLLDFHEKLDCEAAARQRNYDLLRHRLADWAIDLGDGFKTFFVMRVNHRDALRQHLQERRIYLPAHWRDRHGFGNPLADQILSIPVDSRYRPAELEVIASHIRAFLRAD